MSALPKDLNEASNEKTKQNNSNDLRYVNIIDNKLDCSDKNIESFIQNNIELQDLSKLESNQNIRKINIPM